MYTCILQLSESPNIIYTVQHDPVPEPFYDLDSGGCYPASTSLAPPNLSTSPSLHRPLRLDQLYNTPSISSRYPSINPNPLSKGDSNYPPHSWPIYLQLIYAVLCRISEFNVPRPHPGPCRPATRPYHTI